MLKNPPSPPPPPKKKKNTDILPSIGNTRIVFIFIFCGGGGGVKQIAVAGLQAARTRSRCLDFDRV